MLRAHRERAGLSQQRLVKATNLSRQGISCWEKNIRTPKVTACIKLVDFYGISLEELLECVVKKGSINQKKFFYVASLD